MTLETAFIFTISLILLWIKPGPGQALKITRALNDGFLAAFYIVLGVITGCMIFFLVAVFGLGFITHFFEKAGFWFQLVGAAYLIYLGYKGLSNIESGKWEGRTDKTHKRKFLENYPTALLLTLANPLPIFFFLGIMPTFVPIGEFMLSDILIGLFILVFVGLNVDILLIILVTQVKQSLSNVRFVKNINIFTSISFILLGSFFLYSAFFLTDFSYEM